MPSPPTPLPKGEGSQTQIFSLFPSEKTSFLNNLEGLKTDIRELKGEIKALDVRIQGIEIKLTTAITKTEGIKKRVDDLNSGLNIMTVGFLSIVGVLVAGILGIIGKIVFFPNNP